jgi:hypothetical protein
MFLFADLERVTLGQHLHFHFYLLLLEDMRPTLFFNYFKSVIWLLKLDLSKPQIDAAKADGQVDQGNLHPKIALVLRN